MSNTNNSTPTPSTLARIDIHVFRAPIDVPIRTSFGVMTDRPAVLVRIEDSDGAYGWGEVWCNFPTCGAEHRARLIETVIAPLVIGQSVDEPTQIKARLDDRLRVLALQTREFGPLDQAIAGIDIAIWDLLARRCGKPLWQYMHGARSTVPVYASGINPELAPQRIAEARNQGMRAFKIKIGFDRTADQKVVAAAARDRREDEQLMLDANQAWTPGIASDIANELAGYGVEWLEEAIRVDAPASQWKALAQASPIPLAGGENLVGQQSFEAAIDGRWLSVIQPDICKWGGLTDCLPLANVIVDSGLRYCPHYLGGGVGLIASGHLLAAVGGDGLLEVDCNPNPLRELLAQPYPGIKAGQFELGDAPGLGIEPLFDEVKRWQVLHNICH